MALRNLTPNMGMADRIIRGILGGLMLFNGLTHFRNSPLRRLETLAGGASLMCGLSGVDPLLKVLGASTIPGAENNILNQLKQAAPGQGINPMLTQQAIPKRPTRIRSKNQTIAEQLAIR